jgi:hypothetical protein
MSKNINMVGGINFLTKIKKIISFILKEKFFLLILVIAALIHYRWFIPDSLFFHGDWRNWPDENVSRFIWGGYGTYIDDLGFGYQNIQIYLNAIFFLWGIIGSYLAATKITLLLPITFLSVISPFILIKELTKNEKISFVCALFFSFSTILLDLQLAHLFIALAFALVPLIIFSFIKLLERQSTKNFLIFALLYSFGILSELRIMYIATFILLLYTLFFFKKNIFLKKKFHWFLLVLTIGLLNFFWIVPTILNGTNAISEIADRGLFGNIYFNLSYSFAVFDKYWSGNEMIPFVKQSIPALAWLTPLFAFSILLIFNKIADTKDKKNILFFISVSLLGILLTKQSAYPFPHLYSWLYKYFPGFNLFREASKFFLLILIGYLGLLAYFIKYLILENKRINKILKSLALIALSVLFLINTWPVFTGRIGWMFIEKKEPIEYKILNDFIKYQDESFRVLWIPRMSGWGYYNWNKPGISLAAVEQKEYKNFFESTLDRKNYAGYFFKVFEKTFGDQLADISNVKYFVIPMPDKQDNVFEYYGNDYLKYVEKIKNLDFLEEVKLEGLNEIKLYKNKDYKPRIFSFKNLFNINSPTNLENKYIFITNELKQDFYFTTGAEKELTTTNTVNLKSIFEDIDQSSFKEGTLIAEMKEKGIENDLYSNIENNKGLFVLYAGNKITLFTQSVGGLMLNDNLMSATTNEKEIIKTINVGADTKKYYIQVDDKLLSLERNTKLNLGEINRKKTITIFKAGDNIIPNPSFEEGLWQKNVSDCHNYDNNPVLSMELNKKEKSDGNQSLQLGAARHIACTSVGIPINSSGKHVFSFDYQSPNAKEAGYYLSFDDAAKIVFSQKIPFIGFNWRKHTEIIDVPRGAPNVGLFIYAYPSEDETNFINRYDNFELAELDKLTEITLTSDERFIKEHLISSEEENTFTYSNANFNLINIIPNPSFEDGLWQKNVGDCHNYDNNPVLSMELNKKEKSDGNQSLQLGAARHIACTFTAVLVDSGNDYLFGFDHRGSNTNQSSYNISFNDENKTFIKRDVRIDGADWQKFFQTITVPRGATAARIYLYSKPPENGKKSINFYDDITLIRVPKNIKNDYYLVGIPEQNLILPRNTIIESDKPTKKIISVRGAVTPFYLALSEGYHPRWQLSINKNNKNHGFSGIWEKFVDTKDKISDTHHFKLNYFLNAWYIDVNEICSKEKNCLKNPDGSYDIRMTVEFWTQKWFYIGAIISIFTFFGCLITLLYLRVKTQNNDQNQ